MKLKSIYESMAKDIMDSEDKLFKEFVDKLVEEVERVGSWENYELFKDVMKS